MAHRRFADALSLLRTYLEHAIDLYDYEIGGVLPETLAAIELQHCPDIDEARAGGQQRRYYAHVDHHDGVICVAAAIAKLPPRKQAGILCHELGHLLADVDEISPTQADLVQAGEIYPAGRVEEEAKANVAAREYLGVVIRYDHRDHVQYLDASSLARLEA